MTEVLKALQELNVSWKKIGHYNMKCRWIPGIAGHREGMVNNSMQSNHYFGDDSTIIESDGAARLPNVVKFEVQVIILYYFHLRCTFNIANCDLSLSYALAIFVCRLPIFLSSL